jgi:hypothetical protein
MYTDIILQKLDELNRKVSSLIDSTKKERYALNEWLDKEETMRILKCSERTLQSLRDRGILAYSRPLGGTKMFYRRKDVMALFEKNFNGSI